MIKQLHSIMWRNIISATKLESEDLSAYRKIFILVYMIIFLPNALWIADMPNALFYPPKYSLAAYFNGFPHYFLFITLHIIVLICLLFVGLDKFKKLAGSIGFFAIIIIANFKYSLGKIDHLLLLPLAWLSFSLSNWKHYASSDKGILPIPGETLLAIFIAFGMFTAGFQKSFNWIDFDLDYSGFLAWYYPGYLTSGRTYFLASIVPNLPELIIESLDYVAIIFELTPFIILLLGKRGWWKFWILIACFFHMANLLLMNIQFHYHILVYIPFLLPTRVVNYFNSLPENDYKRALIAISITQAGFLVFAQRPIVPYFIQSLPSQLTLSLILWLVTFAAAIIGFVEFIKRNKLVIK